MNRMSSQPEFGGSDDNRLPSLLPEMISRTPSKSGRSLSDTVPRLEPSPTFKASLRKSKDDQAIPTPARRPSRLDAVSQGLFLQMPARETSAIDFGIFYDRPQPSPQIESSTTVLPRHSRGLDFSRACTNLHHSTLADHPSPDASPTLTHKSMMIPSRRQSAQSMILDSPRPSSYGHSIANGMIDKPFFPRSVGSTNAFTSDASSSSSDNDDNLLQPDDQDDDIMTTPQVRKADNNNAVTPFGGPRGILAAPFAQSPMTSAFASPRNDRLARNSLHHGVQGRTMRSAIHKEPFDGVYLGGDVDMVNAQYRRDSISQSTHGLHISSSNESGDEGNFMLGSKGSGVIKRAVVRRSNLLVFEAIHYDKADTNYHQPKTKGFARIRAALQEESAPIDSDTKREAEVVRQVRVNDFGPDLRQPTTAPSSPEPHTWPPMLLTEGSEMSDIDALGLKGSFNVPQRRVSEVRANLASTKGVGMNVFGRIVTPPPPPPFRRARSSSCISEDTSMESPNTSTPPSSLLSNVISQTHEATTNESAFSVPFQPPYMPSAAAISRKANKRGRDDDFDESHSSIKRRAVSPGMMSIASVQSSPVPGQSPWSTRDSSTGPSKSDAVAEARPAFGVTTPVLGPKRIGLQGMTDTHDGIMKMSIE